jgi:hypothetical protein
MKSTTILITALLLLMAAGGLRAQQHRRTSPRVELALLSAQPDREAERGLRTLGATVARRTSVEMDSGEAPVIGPLDGRLFEHPLVVMTGSGEFPAWGESERDALRTYLSLGGMILLDDRSAKDGEASPFVSGAKRELARAVGGRDFELLPAEHSIFRAYYLLDRAWGRVDESPQLEALMLDGRAAVVVSRNDLLGALARDEFGQWSRPVEPGGRRQRELALRLGVNMVLYALTLDYKEDLVHLPHILERRR